MYLQSFILMVVLNPQAVIISRSWHRSVGIPHISNQYDVWSPPEACCNVSLARLCTFIRRLFIGKLCMVEWQRIPTLVDFNRVGCVTSCEINRAETNRQADTNGDLCCQSVTSKLLFLLCYTFHPTCNLIGKSLTR